MMHLDSVQHLGGFENRSESVKFFPSNICVARPPTLLHSLSNRLGVKVQVSGP